jgi:uncharacterized membrane protein
MLLVSVCGHSEFSKQAFLNNLKKYLYLLGIQDRLEIVGNLISNFLNGKNQEESKFLF